jgi:hypothetical protein
MLRGLAPPLREFLAGQFDGRHVRHVLIVDDKVDRIVLEGQAFAVGMGAEAGPTAGLGSFGLELQEGAGDIQRHILNPLLLERQQFLS